MNNRLEYKFMVPNKLLDVIRSEIKPFVTLDTYASKGDTNGYTVRSIYYDTRSLSCYHEKIEGEKIRRKFRIRGYNHAHASNFVYLEIKKKYLNFISKSRAPFKWIDIGRIINDDHTDNSIDSNFDRVIETYSIGFFLYHYYRKKLCPAVLVVYDREAFYSRFDTSLRLTFDKHLRSLLFPSLDSLYENGPFEYALRNHFILEVKFYGRLPDWIVSIIKRYQLPRMALSKYAICLDSHRNRIKHLKRGITFISPGNSRLSINSDGTFINQQISATDKETRHNV